MKHFSKAIAALTLTLTNPAHAASVLVDWLTTQAGGTAAAFTMVDDSNNATANGSVTLTAGIGVPGLPRSQPFAAGNWGTQPEVADTLTGDAGISAMEFRVWPSAGSASYVITLQVPANQPFIVAVGGLLQNSTSATQGVTLAALSDSGSVPVVLRSTNAWSTDLLQLNQGLSWNPLTQILSPASGANGDSQFAFFEVGAITGANPRLSFAVPFGYAAGSGDSIYIGVGAVIPEPATAGLLLLGTAACVGRRRRGRAGA